MLSKKLLSFVLTGIMAASLFAGCSSKTAQSKSDGKVQIEFLQSKTEAKGTFDKLIAKFEEENPNIKITQTNTPDSSTVLRTRVAKKDVPDVVAVGADTTFADVSKAGVFEDLSNSPQLKNIQPAYVQMVKDVAGTDKVYAIPYAANGAGVIYNKKMFAELGLTVPKTWDEFIAVADKIKAAGKIPFYLTLKDSWTTLPPFNIFVGNTQGDNFFADRAEGKTTFKENYKEAVDKYLKLTEYGQSDIFGKTYSDGNVAFGKGESVMYLQGIWALAEIKKANPDIDLGVFPLPVTNDPSKTKVVSGVDLLLSLSKTSKHPEEAKKFINFLLKEETAKTYINEQKCFSAITGITQEDSALSGLKESFEKGALVDFPDHRIPPALSIDRELQALVKSKDVDKFLTNLDKQWDSLKSRKK
ncbi:sugar ABC transporter substrate-binding protein [Clostridium polyendosporum]|uniref:Sugar ABC transporter substrate-binding protein n=1 Tax=Clostridium polyendosporum TaxID=69208 RepID=A0A919RWS6_9CLOT|nr:extracellular solute-binding protein [Clostridium polyendosporum]GIM27712.1 sugar ABC transporter substrate-binding protein [Clostridium polyendosporum]